MTEGLDRFVLEELRRVHFTLAEIKTLLVSKHEVPPENLVPLADFCKRLGRTHWWGYQQIRARRIIPAKSGKPYMVPIEQLTNFLPPAKRRPTST